MSNKPQRGGKRPGAGRPKLSEYEATKMIHAKVLESQYQACVVAGKEDNVSDGLRLLIEAGILWLRNNYIELERSE